MELTTFVPMVSQRKMQHETLSSVLCSTRDTLTCNLHGIISRAFIEAAALNWLNNNDQGLNRPRPPPEGFLTRFLNIFGEKIGQTQIAVEEAMAELGWLDGATENVTGATEHTNS